MTLTKMDRKRMFKAMESAYYEGFYDSMWNLPARLRHMAFDTLVVAEEEPWRTWDNALDEVLTYFH
jgi:hypothetical protein